MQVGTLGLKMRVPEVQLLWWKGCPSTERATVELRAALRDVGLDAGAFQLREIRTDADADEAGFKGSPTILVDGEDVGGAEDPDGSGLSCRVYRRGDGQIAATPDPDDLRDALRRAMGPDDR
jgi:hypothetical protein